MKERNRAVKKIVIIVVAVLIVAAALFVVPKVMAPKEEAEVIPPPVVKTEQPAMGTIELSTGLIGKVEPSDVVYITPKMAGTVTEIFVKAGDTVAEGQLLCKIDTNQVDSAKLSMDAAAIALQDVKTNLGRMQVLFSSGDISAQAFEQVQSGVKSAQIQYDGAKLAYDLQIKFSNITAPISGIVESIDMEVHDTVSQQNLICVIAGAGSKAVSFSVTERVVANVKDGDQVRIEKNGGEYVGTVSEVSSMVDAATGLFKVKASVAEGDTLATGTSVKLYVTSNKVTNAMTLPVDAVYYSGGESFVYTCEAGMVHKTLVEVGISDVERIQVTSGLTLEDQIITSWSPELYEGAPVLLAESTTEPMTETTVQ